ncbi:MAG TPA: nitroreductase family protein, partial [Oceanospirillaceae bacterium]|nr:nitroreductase family protein [Oceanospirillaceae bacterium]
MFSLKDLKYQPIPLPDRIDMPDTDMIAAAQTYYQTMRRRHSVRDFCDRPVPKEIIAACIKTAGSAPSGANHQPWHFVAIENPDLKKQIRLAAEEEEKRFYAGGGGDEWIKALEPIGTNADKPHLEIAPWLIVIFAQRYGELADGKRYKNYYVPDSVGIA